MKDRSICFVMRNHINERGGGAEVQAWLLAQELATREFQVYYIAQSLSGKAGQVEESNGVKIYWLKNQRYFEWLNALRLYRTLKIINPNLIVQRLTSFSTGVLGLYTKYHHNRFVWMCTDNRATHPWSHLKRVLKALENRTVFSKLKSSIFIMNAVVYDLSWQVGFKYVTHPFTQNKAQEQSLKKLHGRPSHRMLSGHKIPSSPITPFARYENKMILWVGNLAPRKRPELFVQLAAMCTDEKWRFIVIGDRTEAGYTADLFKNKTDNLVWLGRLPFNETQTWFNKATIFVNTSFAIAEGFPNTYIQSWLRGIPVVTVAVDPDGIIREQSLGAVCPDLVSLRTALKQILSNSDGYAQMNRSIIGFARENFTISNAVDKFLQALM